MGRADVLTRRFSPEQTFGIGRGHPSSLLGDADGHYLVFIFVDGVENRRGRKQRDFMLAAAATKEYAHANFFHELLVWTRSACGVNCGLDSLAGPTVQPQDMFHVEPSGIQAADSHALSFDPAVLALAYSTHKSRLDGCGHVCSKDLLAESRQRQFHGQVGSSVVLVDYRIDFDDFETEHAAMVGDNFHCQVSLAIGGAAADRGAYPGGVFGIDPIHVEGNVVAGGAASGDAESFFHDGAHAALIDIAHGEDMNAGAAHIFFFDGVDVAHSHQDAVFRTDLGRKIEN